MTFRVGDIVRHADYRLGLSASNVENVDGTRIKLKRRNLNGLPFGRAFTSNAENLRLVHTDWKEHELWILLWRCPGSEDVRKFVFSSEEQANQDLQAMRAEPRDYEVISTHKITLPYKDPQ